MERRFFTVTRATDILAKISSMPPGAPSPLCAAERSWKSGTEWRQTMNYSYWRTERLILDAVDRRILRRATAWEQIIAPFISADLLVVLAVCVFGLLATFVVLMVTPDGGEIAEALQLF
jgi:hypothetical protein